MLYLKITNNLSHFFWFFLLVLFTKKKPLKNSLKYKTSICLQYIHIRNKTKVDLYHNISFFLSAS